MSRLVNIDETQKLHSRRWPYKHFSDEVYNIMSQQPYALSHFFCLSISCTIKAIGSFTVLGAPFGHRIARFCVTFVQFLRYYYISVSMDTHGDSLTSYSLLPSRMIQQTIIAARKLID
jgi:hypothetical protein